MTLTFQPGLHRFAVFTAASTLLLLVAGALVTSNDAGLAVPDWPLSYGSLMPPMVGGIFYEHGHRLVATFVGMLTIILAVWLWRREPRRWVRWLGIAALAAVVVQGVLGGLTVIFMLPTAISIAHASLGQLFFCTIVTLALVTSRWWQSPLPPVEESTSWPVRTLAVGTCAAIFMQLVLGAAFRHKGIGILPHLVGAAIVATLAYRTSAVLRGHYSRLSSLRFPAGALSALVTLQLVLGGAALWARLVTRDSPQPVPALVWVTVAHVMIGAITLAAGVVLALCAFRVLAPAGQYALDSGPERAAI